MRQASRLRALIAAATFAVVLFGSTRAAEALHCPGPPNSYIWGTCIGPDDGPGGQTVVAGSAEMRPALDCVDADFSTETSGELQWCETYAVRVSNNCASGIEFEVPVLSGDNRRILPAGEQADVVGLQACAGAPRARSGHLSDGGLDASGPSDTTDATAADAADVDVDADSGSAPPSDTTAADAAGDAAHTRDADAGGSLDEACGAFETPDTPGEHTASFAFAHAGQGYELVQSVETISFEEWYEEKCGEETEPTDTGTPVDSGRDSSNQQRGDGSCSCTTRDSSRPPVGGAFTLVLVLAALRLSRPRYG